LYAASVRFFEIPVAALLILHSVLHPFQVEHYRRGSHIFMRNLRLLAQALSLSAIVISIMAIILAPWVVAILPESYAGAAPLLQIEFIGLLFLFNGSIRDIYFNIHRRQKVLVWITVSSAGINILLNYLLIPVFGASVAAWATVITQAIAFLLLHALWKSTLPLFIIQVRALWPSEWLRMLRRKS
jgi:O-antigen/teichoic acid export membrane protein